MSANGLVTNYGEGGYKTGRVGGQVKFNATKKRGEGGKKFRTCNFPIL